MNRERDSRPLSWSTIAPDGYGFKIEYGKDIGEIHVFKDLTDPSVVRCTWVMVKKSHQRQGIARRMLNELKSRCHEYFPSATRIRFVNVTSFGMLRLISDVFHTPLDGTFDLPEQSPAKYNPDGSCYIPKRVKKVDFEVEISSLSRLFGV
ncbi:GNAT family N-acetyltransferase [Alicyclobacillus shizuokensis]|uniref:GNAT family N-acetyltransferase n=1 Tax=Alicyclobacillus shizuokensis TaxID=392014 RepID=UPI001C3F3033|nr:GNAT family N-acetyltransferase [Alicyclobacillus shizuokensis]